MTHYSLVVEKKRKDTRDNDVTTGCGEMVCYLPGNSWDQRITRCGGREDQDSAR